MHELLRDAPLKLRFGIGGITESVSLDILWQSESR